MEKWLPMNCFPWNSKLAILTLLMLGLPLLGLAQHWNVWTLPWLGGLDFNYEPPRPFVTKAYGGQTAAICDSTGQLIAYYDWYGLYDGNHDTIVSSADYPRLGFALTKPFLVPSKLKADIYYLIIGRGAANHTVIYYQFAVSLLANAPPSVRLVDSLVDPLPPISSNISAFYIPSKRHDGFGCFNIRRIRSMFFGWMNPAFPASAVIFHPLCQHQFVKITLFIG